ncbi:hypothetical protein [Roseivivax isoporae]|uniref:Ferric siderophore reductase C-terminal domain-containing protein n=1 Tax=Roseivivax isoporae LMG 25204 TaxID=1449351 RepID=X7FC95_9RHOB|nr:hypothetical protein [Roseivivax isoporae]ETX30368.1 hypothetical protein RISW2_16155 [Roseivivax isoporae LMG 25204]
MNVLAHVAGPVLARWDAEGRSLARVDAEAVALTARLGPEGFLTLDLDATPPPVTAAATGPGASFAVARLLAPSVNALAYAGPLAPRALWRIAGDGLAWGWMQAGAPDRAAEVLGRYGAPFANRQLRLSADRIARRGGCCRYLSVSGAACLNCPLRKDAA